MRKILTLLAVLLIPDESIVFAQDVIELPEAVNFTAVDLSDSHVEIDFSAYKGRPLVLFFWDPNRQGGVTDFGKVATFAAMNHEVSVVTVYWASRGNDNVVRMLLRKHLGDVKPANLLILKDSNDGEVHSRIYKANLLPCEVFFINNQGKIAVRKVGSLDWNSIRISLLLKELGG